MLYTLRLALRSLLKNPGLAAAAVFIMALGIGANTVVFSLVHGLVLQPLSFEQPDRLVRFYGSDAGQGRDRQRVSELTVDQVREQAQGLVRVAGARNMGMSVTDSERPLNPLMRTVTTGWFELFGIDALLGRTFSTDEHRDGAQVTVLHHDFWQSYFGGDPEVVGQTIELNQEAYEIVGVMPPTFFNPAFPLPPVLWLPATDSLEPEARQRNHVLIARLDDDTTVAAAQREADRVARHLAQSSPETHETRGLRVLTLHRSLIERFEPAIVVLFAAVGFVLLIACSNVANLLLARALRRRQEIAMRRALGAGRRHLIGQMLSESLVISVVGGALGLLVAAWSLGPISRLAPSNVTMPLLDRVSIQPNVVLFCLALAAATTVIIGLVPLRQLSRDTGGLLSVGAVRATGGRGRRRLRSSLVIAELALSMVLLVGAGLTLRSFQHLRALDLGFDTENLIVCRAGARGGTFDDRQRWPDFHAQVTERIANLPGVEGVGAIEFMPTFAGGFGTTTAMAPENTDTPPDARFQGVVMSVTPGFFAAHGQPLLRGREVATLDTADSEAVAVISRQLSRQLFGDQSPVDRRVLVGLGDATATVRIVGLAGDLRGVADNPVPPAILYRPVTQRPVSNMSFFTRLEPPNGLDTMMPAIEDAVWSISRDAPVYAFSRVDQLIRDLEWQPRFMVQLLSGFAFLALVLAATGIYSVLAYAVTERTREIGIRVAVGADRNDILRMVGRDALRLSLIGVGIGALGAIVAGRGLESLLLGVASNDPWTFGSVAVILTAIALSAGYLPARRATRVDPVVALRDP